MFITLLYFNQTVLDHVREDIVLAANSCLTLAWKMRDNSFSVPEFLVEF